MKQLLLTLVCLGLTAQRLAAWGIEAHQAIAQAAYEQLNDLARQKVKAILATEAFTNAAVWPDQIRAGAHPGPLASSAEGKAFNKKFPDNSLWHFVNLPLGTTKYGKYSEFTSPEDVVHMLNACIEALETDSGTLSEREALCWLIHLVGDIHQPLHVACGYYRFDDQNDPHFLTSPQDILNCAALANHDRGGNRLHYTASQNLHAYWESVLVEHVAKSAPGLTDILTSHIAKAGYKNTAGNYHNWPARWAGASVLAAKQAYDGIEFQQKEADGADWFIRVALPEDYQAKNVAVAEEQLSRAAYDLAALLNKIKWNHVRASYRPPTYLP